MSTLLLSTLLWQIPTVATQTDDAPNLRDCQASSWLPCPSDQPQSPTSSRVWWRDSGSGSGIQYPAQCHQDSIRSSWRYMAWPVRYCFTNWEEIKTAVLWPHSEKLFVEVAKVQIKSALPGGLLVNSGDCGIFPFLSFSPSTLRCGPNSLLQFRHLELSLLWQNTSQSA